MYLCKIGNLLRIKTNFTVKIVRGYRGKSIIVSPVYINKDNQF